MPQLNTTISSDPWRSLADHAEKIREPLADIVQKGAEVERQTPSSDGGGEFTQNRGTLG